ncbi:hypothetical protein A5699_21875 [Mycobacterium sp. E802]|uniref:hypothetical protein n=1 Tax=Mycobacterium sp. E802 TaxID=1834152 RepID=UPI0007FE95CF|nr:hypothetical protein [Mycobacterium sp. E802]OBG86438.1 hypothetical protein A5699_21875 [Mycobacterium sp. E802]
MRVDIRRVVFALTCSVSGPAIALSVIASAAADPGTPPAPPAPAPAPTAPGAVAAVAADQPAPAPEGVPHLASPEALPPGSTMDPTGQGTETPNLSYLKDLWHAVQNQEISGKEALILGLAQRGMNTPVPNQIQGPNVPLSPGAPPAAGAPAAPAPGAPAVPAPAVQAAPAPAAAPAPLP